MSQQPVNAHIMGQSYVLAAPSEEVDDLRAAVGRVDEAMCRIRDAGKIKARERIAVLAALNIAFDSQQAQKTAAQTAASQQAPGAETAAAASGGPITSAPTTSAPATSAEALPDEPRLAALLAKLDQALGRDGHLL